MTREQLLTAGRDLVLSRGMQNLSVRDIAAAANANVGSFVYHFGTRDAFLAELIESWYTPLYLKVADVAGGSGTAFERLRIAVLQLVDFGIEHNAFVGRILVAGAAGEHAAREFLASLSARHPKLLLRVIAAAQSEGAMVEEDPMQVMCFLMASVGLPLLLSGAWQGPPLFGKELSAALGSLARDRDRILQRFEWALRALKP